MDFCRATGSITGDGVLDQVMAGNISGPILISGVDLIVKEGDAAGAFCDLALFDGTSNTATKLFHGNATTKTTIDFAAAIRAEAGGPYVEISGGNAAVVIRYL